MPYRLRRVCRAVALGAGRNGASDKALQVWRAARRSAGARAYRRVPLVVLEPQRVRRVADPVARSLGILRALRFRPLRRLAECVAALYLPGHIISEARGVLANEILGVFV